jgi:hypothetical protein
MVRWLAWVSVCITGNDPSLYGYGRQVRDKLVNEYYLNDLVVGICPLATMLVKACGLLSMASGGARFCARSPLISIFGSSVGLALIQRIL